MACVGIGEEQPFPFGCLRATMAGVGFTQPPMRQLTGGHNLCAMLPGHEGRFIGGLIVDDD